MKLAIASAAIMLSLAATPVNAATFLFSVQLSDPTAAPFVLSADVPDIMTSNLLAPTSGFGYAKTIASGTLNPLITPYSDQSIAASGILTPLTYNAYFDIAQPSIDGSPSGGLITQIQFTGRSTQLNYIDGGPTFYYENYDLELRPSPILANFDVSSPLTFDRVDQILGTGPISFLEFGSSSLCQSNQGPCDPVSSFSVRGTATYLGLAPAVPEPSTWAMMLLGFGAIGFAMRRRENSPQLALQTS